MSKTQTIIRKLQKQAKKLEGIKERKEQKRNIKTIRTILKRINPTDRETFVTTYILYHYLFLRGIDCGYNKVIYQKKDSLKAGMVLYLYDQKIDLVTGHVLGRQTKKTGWKRLDYPLDQMTTYLKVQQANGVELQADALWFLGEDLTPEMEKETLSFFIKAVAGIEPSAHAINRYIARIEPELSYKEAKKKLKNLDLAGAKVKYDFVYGKIQLTKNNVVYCYSEDFITLTTVFRASQP